MSAPPMDDRSLVHYRVELPIGSPEQWARHGPGWCDLYVRDGTTDVDVIHECFVEDTYRVRGVDLVRPEMIDGVEVTNPATVVDLGANIGIFSALCLQFGAGRVIAVEPEPANRELLIKNLAAWHGKVEILNAAVGAEKGRATVVGEAGNAHTVDARTVSIPDAAGSVTRVVQLPLEEILAMVDGRVALLKCDVEGAEWESICACPHDVLARVDRLAMEFHGEREAPHLGPDNGRYGALMYHLAKTHAVEVFGDPDAGGYVFAHAYE